MDLYDKVSPSQVVLFACVYFVWSGTVFSIFCNFLHMFATAKARGLPREEDLRLSILVHRLWLLCVLTIFECRSRKPTSHRYLLAITLLKRPFHRKIRITSYKSWRSSVPSCIAWNDSNVSEYYTNTNMLYITDSVVREIGRKIIPIISLFIVCFTLVNLFVCVLVQYVRSTHDFCVCFRTFEMFWDATLSGNYCTCIEETTSKRYSFM